MTYAFLIPAMVARIAASFPYGTDDNEHVTEEEFDEIIKIVESFRPAVRAMEHPPGWAGDAVPKNSYPVVHFLKRLGR